ncbi:MAG: right-handed parallel beta-helix repeat-containing protein [Thermoguttaceae bacterium]|nr:right-handed parallel beta-helix repeat-containing protein [Thermoguttaceae bacterium]
MKRIFLLLFILLNVTAIQAQDASSLLTPPLDNWRHYSDSTAVKAVTDGVEITVLKETPGRLTELGQTVKLTKKNVNLLFSAKIDADEPHRACLQIKLFKDKKEIARPAMNGFPPVDNKTVPTLLAVNTAEADSIQALLRIDTRGQVGKKFVFTEIKLVETETLVKIDKPKSKSEKKDEPVSLTANAPEFEVVPGYRVCSINVNVGVPYDESQFQSKVRFRFKPTKTNQNPLWQDGFPLVCVPGQRCARGTFVHLQENTEYQYEVAIISPLGNRVFKGEFKTKSVDVPVAKTVVLGKQNETLSPQTITESGTQSGYIRYILAPGATIDGGVEKESAVFLSNVECVILEGLTVRGGRRHGIQLDKCRGVQILNCDISNYGRIGTQRVDLDGKYYEQNGRCINNDAGIYVTNSSNLLIERNWVHDPRGTANSWFYSHPAGPNALCIGASTDVAVRYNDFIGSDAHRWNDVSEGLGNGKDNGAIWQDAEVCGNFFGFGNDDGMELDGGQVNARFFYNRTEGCLCGVSTAPCKLGPAWYYNNIFCNAGDEFDLVGAGIKNVFGKLGLGRLHFINNTVVGYGGVSSPGGSQSEYDALANRKPPLFKAFSRNNLYVGGSVTNRQFFAPLQSDFDYDLLASWGAKKQIQDVQSKFNQEQHGIARETLDNLFLNGSSGRYQLTTNSSASGKGNAVPNFSARSSVSIGAIDKFGVESIPFRPIPFDTSVQTIELSAKNDVYTSHAGIKILVKGTDYSDSFQIVQPSAADFFTVTPQSGTLKSDQTTTLTVRVNPAAVKQARRYTSAFAIRTPSGYSRVVSVTVDSRENARLLAQARKDAIYASDVKVLPDGGTKLTFDVPADGEYWLFAKTGSQSAAWRYMSVNGQEKKNVIPHGSKRTDQPWHNVSSPVYGGDGAGPNRPIPLSKGKNTIILYGRQPSDAVPVLKAALAADPDAFRLAP